VFASDDLEQDNNTRQNDVAHGFSNRAVELKNKLSRVILVQAIKKKNVARD
jgi:hypothetical protein